MGQICPMEHSIVFQALIIFAKLLCRNGTFWLSWCTETQLDFQNPLCILKARKIFVLMNREAVLQSHWSLTDAEQFLCFFWESFFSVVPYFSPELGNNANCWIHLSFYSEIWKSLGMSPRKSHINPLFPPTNWRLSHCVSFNPRLEWRKVPFDFHDV